MLGRRLCGLLLVPYLHSAVAWRIVSSCLKKFAAEKNGNIRSKKSGESQIFLLQFASSSLIVRAVLQGAAPAGRCLIGNPGLPEKACTSAVCGPLCRSQLLRP